MNLLVVTYGSAHVERLTEICAKHQVTVLEGSGFTGLVDNGLDGVLIIGDYGDGQQTDGRQVAIDLMVAGDMPVFGMGLGFELLCDALGWDLKTMADQEQAAGRLIPTEDGAKAYQGSDPILIAETKRWCVDEMPRGVAILARSESGIEAIRSKSKPLMAMQQLPNDFTYASDGKLVIENFISLLGRKL